MDREWIDELLSRTDLVRLISRYVPLNKKGRTYWGCCPFHHEKEPSFAVNEEKQFYHCFGCKESGNAISFVQKMESVDFIDAVRLLAAEAKMEVPELKKFKNEGISREKRERLYSLMRAAAKHYYDNLFTDGGKRARDYLGMRQVPDKLVTKFGFGASLGSKEIINFLESKGFTKSEMKEAGLIEQRGADWYDVFYDRMMIPIINNFGEVVAFGGRLINPESHIPVKYRNSSNTPIFDKSKTLYAINLLKKKKQREPIKNVIVCEGYMDVLALHKAGFDTAVASMGTALTMQQAKLIRNYSTNVYICYDGDSAGQTATMRGLDILQAAGLNVKVVSLPDELDPDDFIKARGAAAYQKLLDDALTLPAFKLDVLAKKFDLGAPDGKTAYAIEAIKVIKSLDNPVEREEYLSVIHDKTGYSYDALRQQADITELPEPAADRSATPPADAEPIKGRGKAELFVIASIAHGKEYVDFTEDVYPFLSSDVDRRIYEYALDRFKKGEKPSVSALYTLEKPEEIAEIAEYSFVDGDDGAKYASCLNNMKVRCYKEEKDRLAKEFDTTKDVALIAKIAKIENALRSLRSGGEE